MDEYQVAFIICMNDELEYSECKNYIDRLRIPKGYSKDVIVVREAPSMASGYNAAMVESNAKYKVYLHQDVFIINTGFIHDMLNVFLNNEKVGAFGCIGAKKLGEQALALADWDTGRLLSNDVRMVWEFPQDENENCEVEAVDGFLIATQYDIPWREDIFDGWDFYDISQCMEFRRAGYMVVVPYQNNPWCYHDNQICKMERYDIYREKFCGEYTDIKNFSMKELDYDVKLYETSNRRIWKLLSTLIDRGAKSEVESVFQNFGERHYIELRELEIISNIDRLERVQQETLQFWKEGLGTEELIRKVRELKRLLKRIEYRVDSVEKNMDKVSSSYSVIAAAVVCNVYVAYIEEVAEKMEAYYETHNMQRELHIWKLLREQF